MAGDEDHRKMRQLCVQHPLKAEPIQPGIRRSDTTHETFCSRRCPEIPAPTGRPGPGPLPPRPVRDTNIRTDSSSSIIAITVLWLNFSSPIVSGSLWSGITSARTGKCNLEGCTSGQGFDETPKASAVRFDNRSRNSQNRSCRQLVVKKASKIRGRASSHSPPRIAHELSTARSLPPVRSA